MSNLKLFIICNCIAVVVAFVCVTIASMHFEKAGILWWYIVPMLMSSLTVKEHKIDNEKSK